MSKIPRQNSEEISTAFQDMIKSIRDLKDENLMLLSKIQSLEDVNYELQEIIEQQSAKFEQKLHLVGIDFDLEITRKNEEIEILKGNVLELENTIRKQKKDNRWLTGMSDSPTRLDDVAERLRQEDLIRKSHEDLIRKNHEDLIRKNHEDLIRKKHEEREIEARKNFEEQIVISKIMLEEQLLNEKATPKPLLESFIYERSVIEEERKTPPGKRRNIYKEFE